MAQVQKSINRMSIEHILCSPPYDDDKLHTHHGLPSPASTYYSSEDDDETSSSSSSSSVVSTPKSLNDIGGIYIDNDRIKMYHQYRRAILPYRRRHRKMSKSESDQSDVGGGQKRIPWLPEEDVLLQQGFEQGLSWAMIASTYLPHRSRGCCWGRFKTLKNKKFLNVRRQIRVQAKPWKTLNPMDMQASL